MTNSTIDYLKDMQEESYKALDRIGKTIEVLEMGFKANRTVADNPANQNLHASLKAHTEKVQQELDQIEHLLRDELKRLKDEG